MTGSPLYKRPPKQLSVTSYMTNEQVSALIESLRGGMTSGQADELTEQITAVPEDRQDGLWAKNILSAATLVKTQLGCDKAIKLLNEAYKEFTISNPSSYALKAEMLERLCRFQLEAKKQADAHSTMNRYMYNALKQVAALHPVQKMHYFSFRGFSDYSLKDIRNEEISLAHPREFNDPLDTILVWWLDDRIKHENPGIELDYKILMKKAAEHIKIRCMIGSKYIDKDGNWHERGVEDLNVLMWAHYAKSHTGFCVEYELDRDKLNMTYRSEEDKADLLQAISYVPEIILDANPTLSDALFKKSDFWSYENEIRLCSFDSSNDDEYPTIPCKGAIKAIYLGAKCSDKDRRDMERAIADKDIPLYQMSVDENKLTRFKKTQIG